MTPKENGRAVPIAYHVHRGLYGQIPGALGRSEFGLEIVIAIVYQVFVVGLSFDKVGLLMNFFQNVRLRKSQIDSRLNQLARHWEHEFDRLCALLANSAVVHSDETSWSLDSVWAFLSQKARVLLFGVHKQGETLLQILDPATFAGIVISDDAAVYSHFSQSPKCWAHLLRKAIKLTLQDPGKYEYCRLTDRLLEAYHPACKVQRDGRLSDAGRKHKVEDLDDEILELCGPVWSAELPLLEGLGNDYRLVCNEGMRLMLCCQLFTFFTASPITTAADAGTTIPLAGTNSEAERTLRGAGEMRKTGRTSKTLRGARRQAVITSVIESLRSISQIHALNCRRGNYELVGSRSQLLCGPRERSRTNDAENVASRPVATPTSQLANQTLLLSHRSQLSRKLQARIGHWNFPSVLPCSQIGQLQLEKLGKHIKSRGFRPAVAVESG